MSPITSVLRLQPLEGSEQALIRFFEEAEVFERSRESGGFRSARLLEPVEARQPFLVIAEWDDEQAYARWLANPVREALGSRLALLLVEESAGAIGSLYREAHSHESAVPAGGEAPERPPGGAR